jgi:hypothetical protein
MNIGSANSSEPVNPHHAYAQRHKKLSKGLGIKLSDFLSLEPWVLVDNGSILGFFDWVPIHLRIGPWSHLAPGMLFLMVYAAVCGNVAALNRGLSGVIDDNSKQHYPDIGTPWWWYNILCFVWISAVSLTVIVGPAGYRPWATYSMWTWSILQLRHFLSALAPWLSSDSFLFKVLELTRYPMLIMCSTTFVVWNLILMPFIYFFFMKDEEKRRNFLLYFTRFRLVQIHFFNIVFAYLNAFRASPLRPLALADFMAAWTIAVLYMLWYLLVLDRVGVHIYPIFSPRSPWLMVTWPFLVAVYVLGFHGWNAMVLRTSS